MKSARLALVGLGNVGRRVLDLLADHKDQLRRRHKLEFTVHCVADSSGVAVSDTGFNIRKLSDLKRTGGQLAELPEYGDDLTLEEALERTRCQILLEASPVNLKTGGPGLRNSRIALERGIDLVLANKSPLALAQQELADLCDKTGAGMLCSATFCGGLPVLNVIRRDMVCGTVTGIRGIFNGTTNFMLKELLDGRHYDDALRQAQDIGATEADPTLDVGGWDTAAKLVIATNTFKNPMISISDVSVTGIENVGTAELERCRHEQNNLKLIASAECIDNAWSFTVEPRPVPFDSFLGGCNGWEMAVEVDTDIYGKSFYKLWEREPVPTAASMLRDAVHLAHRASVPAR